MTHKMGHKESKNIDKIEEMWVTEDDGVYLGDSKSDRRRMRNEGRG